MQWREAHLRLEALILCGRLLLLQHAQADADAAVVAAKGEALERLRGVLPTRHKGVVLYAQHILLTPELFKTYLRQLLRKRPGYSTYRRGAQAGTHMQGGSCGEVRAAVLLIATTAVANVPVQRLKQVSRGGAAGMPSLVPAAAPAAAAVGVRWTAAQAQKVF